jgi:hypothetical protein
MSRKGNITLLGGSSFPRYDAELDICWAELGVLGLPKLVLPPFSPSSFTDRWVPPPRVVRRFRTPEFTLGADLLLRQRTRDHDGSCRNCVFSWEAVLHLGCAMSHFAFQPTYL